MKKKVVKICLDVIMAVVLLLMYRKNVLGLRFHEVGGLLLCGLFLIHTLLNSKWVSAVGRNFFSKSLAVKTRLKYSIDVLMLVCVVFIAVSGIMISKVLFPGLGGGGMFWKAGHSFAALSDRVIRRRHSCLLSIPAPD